MTLSLCKKNKTHNSVLTTKLDSTPKILKYKWIIGRVTGEQKMKSKHFILQA